MNPPFPKKQKKNWQRILRAQIRDLWVLLREFWQTLLLFVLLVAGGGLLLHLFYVDPMTGSRIGLVEGFYDAFAMIFFANPLNFPKNVFLDMLFFLIPILGLAVLAEGLLRFGLALTDKQSRGEKWQVAMASTYKNHIVVCGFGKVGYRVTLELLKFEREVVVIESNPLGRFVDKAKDLGIPIIIADARRTTNLMKAHVQFADAIIPCTDDELANLDIALDARELKQDIKVVMRMFDEDLAKRIERGFGIHTAFSTSALTAPIVAAQAMRLNVQHSFYVGEQLLNLAQLKVNPNSAWVGWTLKDLHQRLDVSVIYYRDGKLEDMHPPLDLVLKPGVEILVLTTIEKLEEINRLNQPK
ncbi:MAG: hypothetical protein CL609_16810 [Anaerolineaceae bacterium]|nr:hypothetical protein [Anaerolineaceae bacterium]